MGILQRARLYYIFTDYFNATLLTYLPIFLKSHYNLSGSEFGRILSVAGIFAIFGILIGPVIVNRFKKQKYVIMFEFVAMMIALAMYFFTTDYYVVMLATGFCYFNRMAMYVIGDNMIADIGNARGIPFGKFRSFGSVGWGVCFLLNGFLVVNQPQWFLVVWFFIVAGAIGNLIFLQEEPTTIEQPNIITKTTIKEISKYPSAIHYLVIAPMIYILLQTVPPFANFLVIELGGKVEIYSTVVAILVIIEFVGMFYAHKVRQRMSDKRYLELVALFLIAKVAIVAFASSPILIYGSAIFDAMAFGLILPFNPDYFKASVPKKLNATIMSVFGVVALLAMAIFSEIAGNLMDFFSTRAVMIAYLILAILMLVLLRFLKIEDHKLDYGKEEE